MLARLAAGRAPERLVSLLQGPPGCGKSSLAAAYAASFPGPVAWVTLSGPLAELADLVEACCQALAIALPGFSDHAARLLRGEPDPARLLRHAAGLVANELEALAPTGALLVIDGLEALAGSPSALEWLEHLVDFFPPEGQLVLVSRAKPALRLAPLRLSGGLVELEGQDWTLDAAIAEPGGQVHAQAAGWMAAVAWAARAGAWDPGAVQTFLRESWLDLVPAPRRAALAQLAALPDLEPGSLAALPREQAALALDAGDVLLARDTAGRRVLHPLLRELLGGPAASDDAALTRAATLEAEAPVDALSAYLEAGAPAEALRLLVPVALELVERGAVERLARLLEGFPPPTRERAAWQWARGELGRLRGALAEAEAAYA
ncbi:MAG: transcriptional regulator, partial [Cyanobacteria bacterium RYN_339]|nr:transcriptional regulator [Cyanobacteria bacterium RYN_339]